MNYFLKNIGIWIIIIGCLFLIIPFFVNTQTNYTLGIGWLIIIIGFIIYIFIQKNKKV